MKDKMRILSEKPLNAETPHEYLRSWITANAVFFDRNQGEIPQEPIALSDWQLATEGEVERPLRFSFDRIYRMPKAIVANTLAYERDVECFRLWEQRGPGSCGSCSNYLTVNTSNGEVISTGFLILDELVYIANNRSQYITDA